MSILIEQIRRAKADYMANVYDGYGKVKGFLYFTPYDWMSFRAEVQPYQLVFRDGAASEFEGIEIEQCNHYIEQSFVQFMFSNDKPPVRYSMATAKSYWLEGDVDDN